MSALLSIFFAFSIVSLFDVRSNPLWAQASSTSTSLAVQGKIISFKGSDLKVGTASGDVLVKLVDSTKLITESPIKLSDIKAGLYVGATAQKQPDGSFMASALHVFADDERGLSEGHRPSSSVPNSTMTNANVERVEDVLVQDVKGPMLTLRYKVGEVKVFVPPNTPIVKRVPGELGMLKTEATVRVLGTKTAEGTISASSITIRPATN